MIINNSKGKIIHTQRNNEILPFSSCNVTSFVNAMKYSDIVFDYPKSMQPEDYFMELMQSREAYDLLHRKYGKKCKFNPWNSSDILVEVCNKMLVRHKVVDIRYMDAKSLLLHLSRGNVMTTSGEFTKSGHFVCIVGYELSENDKLENFIIDDPYGDYHTKYKNPNGNNIKMTSYDFNKIIYPTSKAKKKVQFFKKEKI